MMTECFPAPNGKTLWLGALLLAATLFIVYAPHLGNGFVYDDHFQIEASPYLQDGVSWLEPFRRSVWEHMQATTVGEAQPYYRPLLYVSYRVAFLLGDGAPWAFHLISLLLHGSCAGLAWLTLVRLGMRRSLALAATGIFALHPLAAEQVYYAANIAETLLLAGMLLALIGTLAAHEATGWARCSWLVTAALGTALALFAKETGVVIPLLLTLESLREPRPAWGRRLTNVIPPWLLLGGYLAVRAAVLAGAPQSGWAAPALEPFGSAGYAIFWYARQLLLPFPLTPFHSFPQGWWVMPLGLLSLAGLAALCVWLLRTRPAGMFWLGWLVLPLLPPLLLFFRNSRAVSSLLADHNLYSSLVPAAALLVIAGYRLLQARVAPHHHRALAVGLVVMACLAGGVISHLYGSNFASDEKLFEYAYHRDPDNITVLSAKAYTFYEKGEYEPALALLQRALALQPKYARTHLNLGRTLLQMDRPAEAAVHLQQVVVMGNALPDVYDLLAEALSKAGNLRGASYYYQQSLALDPGRTETRVNLALSLYTLGQVTEAINHLQQAVADVPDHEVALFNLGMIYYQANDQGLARYYLRRYLAVADTEAVEMRAQASRWIAEPAQGK